MKASMYFNYTTRSLLRGGQRTVLALFCVAVGVMAIVSLQLVGQMINNALTSNVRDANGGDIAVSSTTRPFTPSDLSYFTQLKSQGTITNFTAYTSATGSLSNASSITDSFNVQAVDPSTFPIVTPPNFTTPSNGSIPSLLIANNAIIDSTLANRLHKNVGDTMDVHVGARAGGSERVLSVKIAGIVTDSGVLSQSNGVMLVSQSYFNSTETSAPVVYDTVDVTTVDASHTDKAVQAINSQFPLATTQTASDALKSQQSLVDNIKKFLEIAGLLALLIGGVGIVNTMQVLLSRRRTEIAMLKTTGYRRFDLYLLFGLEAGLLGLVGGAIGALAATGVSFLVRNVVQQAFSIHIPFVLDPLTIGGGVAIGLVTALIFGLMPIVQAANIRPLNVIRDLPGGNRAGSVALTIVLLLILSVLFCILSVIILNDVVLGIGAVYGTFVFLGLLSLFFSLIVLLVGKLPVPERFNWKFLALLLAGVIVSVLIALELPEFGFLLLAVTIMGFVIVLLPRSWKSNTKIALRNIGRQRARTTTTLLALFVGIFTIGLILVLGQNLRDKVNNAIATNLTYNVITLASKNDVSALQNGQSSIPGLKKAETNTITNTVPVSINNQPIADVLKNVPSGFSFTSLGRQGVLIYLSGAQGYDVAHNQVPDTSQLTITDGRNLNASDAGQNNILIAWQLAHLDPLKGRIGVGSTLMLASVDSKQLVTVHVVGVYRATGFSTSFEPILTTNDAVQALTPAGYGQSVFYMKIDNAQVSKALSAISSLAPKAYVLNLANIGDYIDQYLNYMLLALTTIAGLSLLAGVIIIANAVALAMLERRRELGILKSVGYTSGTVLSEVLIENGVIGGLGATLAMLLVALAMNLLGRFFFHSTFDVNGFLVLILILGAALLAMLTAAVVAFGSVRVRPLEVLRYE
ncbi:MAG TPA: FtsX-like permease family protein [Ktedonobacteraceae bacterium]|nr:FtsX-like permease family protein [Ktedonobacteraceae bacterium]